MMEPDQRAAIAKIQLLRGRCRDFGRPLLVHARRRGLGVPQGPAPTPRLYLSHTEVTDAGLEHLKLLSQLQTLDLGGTKVTDAGLEHLKDLAQLQSLDLGGTEGHRRRSGTPQGSVPTPNIGPQRHPGHGRRPGAPQGIVATRRTGPQRHRGHGRRSGASQGLRRTRKICVSGSPVPI